MINHQAQQLVVSESTTGTGTTTRDIVIQGAGLQLGVVMPARTSGSLSIEVYPLVGGTYQAASILSVGPLSSASQTALVYGTETSWSSLRIVATYTGTLTYQIHAKATEVAPVTVLAADTTVDLAAGATVAQDLDALTTISSANTYNSTLATGNTYTGTWEEVTNYPDISVLCYSTQAVTVYVDFSMDGSTTHRTITYNAPANMGIPHRLARIASHFRVRVVNASGSTSTVTLQTILGAYSKSHLTTNLSASLTATSDAELTRTVLTGETDGGIYHNVPVTSEGHIEVAIHDPRLPFSSIHTEKMRPTFQIDGVYGTPPIEAVTTTSGSGVANGSNGLMQVSTGTTIASQAVIQSRKRLRYRPGQGSICRFTAMFTTPVASSYQVAGMGHGEDGYFFAYKDTQFGILHNYRGVREVQTLTISVGSSTAENVTVTLNDTPTTVAVTNSASTLRTAYEISLGTFPGWKAEPVGSTVRFVADAVGDKAGTFTLAGTTATGTFAETKAGAAANETFIAQSDWNLDKLDGTEDSGITIDPTKLNVYQIGMAYLGAGAVTFQVMASVTGNNPTWTTVHTINNPNNITLPHVGNPSFPFTMAAYSAGSTTNLTVSSGSAAGFIEGDRYVNGPRLSYSTQSTAVGDAAYRALFSVRNARYYGGRTNQSVINILSTGYACKHGFPVTIYLFRDATLAGTPNFSSYATGSTALYDTAATTCTISSNAQLIWSGTLGETGNSAFAFSDDITLQPGEMITVAAQASSGTPSYVLASLNTREDQ